MLLSLVTQHSLFMAVVVVLCRIWRSRNWVVFDGKQFSIPALMRQFNQRLQEWVTLSVDTLVQSASPSINSIGPGGSTLAICMWDGTTCRGSHSAGKMVILGPDREVLSVAGIQIPLIDDPMVVECPVLREAILWCLGLGFTEVRFEGYAKTFIDELLRADVRDNRMGVILEEIMRLFAFYSGFLFDL
ncbi:unnamed protein product [Linum trigynum]|uniref:RNase H type-1 domain-containing protein n=1 Tax=Linum trigynum TaxID=586398 RepID=A0AAV2FAM2_9ROSI